MNERKSKQFSKGCDTLFVLMDECNSDAERFVADTLDYTPDIDDLSRLIDWLSGVRGKFVSEQKQKPEAKPSARYALPIADTLIEDTPTDHPLDKS